MEFVLKAKNTIKRIAAISAITLMGATAAAGAVAAADLSNYPDVFVENGLWAAQIVMGADAKPADIIGATNLAVSITNDAGEATTTTTSTVAGGARLETADNKLNFYEEINAPRATLTDSQLPALLADGQYTNDKGVTYGYTQQVEIQSDAIIDYNEYDDVSESPDAYVYQDSDIELLRYKMIFTNAAESTITAAELADFKDTSITIMGSDYEITDADVTTGDDKVTLYLMGGAAKASMYEGDSATYTIDGVNYEVTVTYVGSTTSKLTINGESTKELSEGQTDKVAGITIGIKEVLENEAGEVSAGRDSVEFYLGANKVTMEDDEVDDTAADTSLTEIKVSEDTIDGVYVEIGMTEVTNAGTAGQFDNSDVWEMNTLTFYYYPDDPLYVYKDHPYVDPALDAWKLDLANIVTENEETIKIQTDASDRVRVTVPMTAGEVDVPAFYIASSVWYKGKNLDKTFFDDENDDVYVDGDEYFVVSSSSNKESYLMQIAKLDLGDNQISFRDVMTGDKYMVTYAPDITIDGNSDGTFTIGSLTIDIDINETATATGFQLRVDMEDDGDYTGRKVPFYTKGGATVRIYNESSGGRANNTLLTPRTVGDDIDWDGTNDQYLCDNNGYVHFSFTGGTPTNTTIGYFIYNWSSAVNTVDTDVYGWYNGIRFLMHNDYENADLVNCNLTSITRSAGVSIIEEYQDENTVYGAVYVTVVEDSAGGSNVGQAYYADRGGGATTNDSDDTDFSLNSILDTDVSEDYTEYGTKVIRDATSSDSVSIDVIYTDGEAYGEVWLSPAGAVVTTGGAAGGAGYTMPTTTIAVSDADANTAKPLILVGGPCINKLTAQAMGLSYPSCGASSTIPENAAIIKLVENALGGTKTAMIVAGWSAADTTAALNIMRDYKAYAASLKGTGVKVAGTTITALGSEPSVS